MTVKTNWQLIDHVEAPVIVLNDAGEIQHANPSAQTILRANLSEKLNGFEFASFLEAQQAEKFNDYFKGGDHLPSTLDVEIRSPSGEKTPVSLRINHLPGQEGEEAAALITLELRDESPDSDSPSYRISLEDVKWLADQGRSLLSLGDKHEILDFAGDSLQNKLGKCIIIALTKINESSLRLEAIHGIKNVVLDRAWKLVGMDFLGREFPIDDRFRETYATRSLYKHPGGLADFAVSQIPAKLSGKLAEMVGVEDIYAIGLEGNRQLLGCFYLFNLDPGRELPSYLIEPYVFQVALALEKSIFAADLAKSESKFHALFEYAPDGYYLADSRGYFLAGNKAAEEITGFSRDELIGKNMIAAGLLSKGQLPLASKLLAKNILGNSTGPDEFFLTRKDGSGIPVEVHTHPVTIEDEQVILGIARDISDRQKTEEHLIKAHDTLTRVLEGIDAHVYVADIQTFEILYMNRRMIEDFGGDFTGKICHDVFLNQPGTCSHCTIDRLLDSQGYPGDVVVWESQNPKTGRWYKNFDRAIYWEDQRLVKLQIAVDITDTMETSKALEISENRYRSLFENSHTALMTLAPPDWDFITGNAAMQKLFHIKSGEDVSSLQPWRLSPEFQPDGRRSEEKALEMIQKAVENGSHFFNWTHLKTTGEEFQATVQLSRVEIGESFVLQATVRDISDRILAEKIMLRQMQELDLLNKLNVTANQGGDIGEILAVFAEEAKRFFGSISQHVFLLEPVKKQLESALLSQTEGLNQSIKKYLDLDVPDSISIPLEDGSAYWEIFLQGEEVVLESKSSILGLMKDLLSAAVHPRVLGSRLMNAVSKLYQEAGIQTIALVPLISEGSIIGLVDLILPYHFSEGDLEVLRSISEQLSVIIHRARAEEDRSAHLRENEFISKSLVESVRNDDIDLICSNLAENVLKVNPGTYVMISLYDPDYNAIRLRALKGVGPLAEKLVKALGKKPEEILIDVSDNQLDDELVQKFTSGKLELVPGGLFSLTRGTIPKNVCRAVEKLAGVDKFYIAGFGLRGESTGGLVLIVKEGQTIQFPAAIETIASHYAVIFERRIVQEEILLRKAQLESLRNVELKITSQLNLKELLQTIAEEARAIIGAAACGFSIYNPDRDVLEYLAYTGMEKLPEQTETVRGEGLSGKVWDQKETLIINNYASWEGRSTKWEEVGNYNLAGIPVIWGEDVLGVLEIAIGIKNSFSPSDIRTLELFSTQAAIAVMNANLYNNEMMRRQEAETLREVGLLINRMMDRGDLLNMILSALQKVVPYHGASLQLVRGKEIVIEAYQGIQSSNEVVGSTFTIRENTVTEEILYGGKQIILNTKEQVQRLLRGPGIGEIQSWIGVPLEIKGNRIGIITLDHSQPNRFTDRDVSLVTDFATQAAIALENNRLFDEIRRRTRELEVVYDSATKLTQELRSETLIEHLYQQIESLFEQDLFILATYNSRSRNIAVEYAAEHGVRQSHAESKIISLDEGSSLISWIIRKKTPLLIGNVETESLPVQPRQHGKTVHSWLGVPLLVGDMVIGALIVQSYRAHAYKHEDQRLLELLGTQVAVALENSRLFADAQKRLSRLSSLREIDMAVSGSVDLELTMEVLISQLIKSLDMDAACVLVYNPDKNTLDYLSGRGFRTKSLRHTSLRIGEGLAGKAAQDRKLVHIPDLREEHTSLERSPLLGKENFITYLSHPLVAKGELVGVLEVFHREQVDPDSEWINFLDALARVAGIAIDRLNLFNDLSRSNMELQQAYDETIEGWAMAIEMRDYGTSEHSRRVVALAMNLARKLGIRGEELTHLRRGALLHDIGKMAIPDGILLKAGKLTEDEWRLMKKHPQYAYDMLSNIDYLIPALDIPYSHHERWDGTGYPEGLTGEEIPLAARIFAVVDVWDALQSDRSYRDAWSKEKAVEYLKDQSGKHFDPQIVEAFLDLMDLS